MVPSYPLYVSDPPTWGAMDSGLTREQASEVLTHMAFYSGWPTIFSALPVFKGVFAGRNK